MNQMLIATILFLSFASPVFADESHHPDQTPAPVAKTVDNTVQQMQDNAKKMQSQLERIGKAKTPEERQKILAEHMQTMRENMMLGQQMAKGDMGCPMMGTMGRGTMGMMGSGGDNESMMNRMHQMEQRMDMMQMMMERQMGGGQGSAAQGK